MTVEFSCMACGGDGYKANALFPCNTCKGTGIQPMSKPAEDIAERVDKSRTAAQVERVRCLKAVDDESEHICYVPRAHLKEVEEIILRVKANIKRRIEEGA